MKLHIYKIRKNKEYCKWSLYCYFKRISSWSSNKTFQCHDCTEYWMWFIAFFSYFLLFFSYFLLWNRI